MDIYDDEIILSAPIPPFILLYDDEYAGYASISPENIHILTYLWYLGHESARYRDIVDRFDITISTLYELLTRMRSLDIPDLYTMQGFFRNLIYTNIFRIFV
ncbi:uncharacterized protein LOC105429683 [Pogonomyrmex barbatus]|uniref:Uncharacterized protein LOC105429683 n=1 Tax=Pogonomyrmex barbatus TaxID=144034 RepID=A0A8N1S989_9HYME|nr:uncharacterized protein LOC105429683 [Pogonomyrmex barbatus]